MVSLSQKKSITTSGIALAIIGIIMLVIYLVYVEGFGNDGSAGFWVFMLWGGITLILIGIGLFILGLVLKPALTTEQQAKAAQAVVYKEVTVSSTGAPSTTSTTTLTAQPMSAIVWDPATQQWVENTAVSSQSAIIWNPETQQWAENPNVPL